MAAVSGAVPGLGGLRWFGAGEQAAIYEPLEPRRLMSVNVTTYHYNNSETGTNTNETVLTQANVNTGTFGKIASMTVDGQIYAQPLVMTDVPMANGQGTRDIVIVATENDSVYAFDAYGNDPVGGYLWHTSLLQAGETSVPGDAYEPFVNTYPTIGITGTPVIDPATNRLYVVGAFAESNGTYQQRLYALDITSGQNAVAPVTIAATVAGGPNGIDSSGGVVSFNAFRENQRVALTLANGEVYVAWAGYGDENPYHGWVIAYNASTLNEDFAWCDTPNASEGGIWMSGGGLAVDSSGNLYFTTGNGDFSPQDGDYGMSIVKMTPSLGLLDSFTPYDQLVLSNADLDYGCSNVILLPTQAGAYPDEVLSAGKWGTIYLNDADTGDLGGYNSNGAGPNDDLSETNLEGAGPSDGEVHNTMVYWNGSVFLGGDALPLEAFSVNDGELSATPTSQTSMVFGNGVNQVEGAGLTLSSNGNANGILWALDNDNYNVGPAELIAYNPDNLGQVLWTSDQAAGGRDTAGFGEKFQDPVVANGHVYIGGSNSLTIYGLLSTGANAPTITAAAAADQTTTTASTHLSIAATDLTGDEAPAYFWSASTAPAGAAAPSFSVNNTSSASACTAAFHAAGNYTLTCTVEDPTTGYTVISSVNVTVTQTLTGIAVTSTAQTVPPGGTDQLTAAEVDQFGNAMPTQPAGFTWSVLSGGGSVDTGTGLYTAPASGTLAMVQASADSLSGTGQVPVLSAPWQVGNIVLPNISEPGFSGAVYNSAGVFNISGGATGIAGGSDQFRYVSQPLGGGGTIIAEITGQSNTDAFAGAGVMIRESLDPNAPAVFMGAQPSGGVVFASRATEDNVLTSSSVSGPTAPCWVKLVRNGNNINGYYSTNGSTWVLDSSASVYMTGTVFIGLYDTSGSSTTPGTATFQGVSLMDATSDTVTETAGVPVSLNVLANDSAPAGTTLTITGVSQGSQGTVTVGSGGVVTYRTSSAAAGTDSFAYTASDGVGDTATGTVTVTILGLEAYYKMDDGSGTTLADATGNGHTATINGASWTSGVSGSALAFNASGASAAVPALNLNSNTITESGWFYSSGSQSAGTGLIFDGNTANADGTGGQGLEMYDGSTLGYSWGTSAGTYGFDSGLTLPAGVWTFAALVITPTDATIYMEPLGGTLSSATNTFANPVEAFGASILIGQNAGSGAGSFNGAIDEVRIYDASLNLSQIGALGQSGSFLTARPVSVTASSFSPGTVNVLANASGPNGSTLSVVSFTQPVHGTVTNNGGGSFTYSTTDQNTGTDYFTCTISDGLGDTATGIVDVTILGLVAKYKFNEGSGYAAADSTGNGHAATLNNTAWTSGATAQSNDYALQFNGSGSVTFNGNSPSLSGLTDFTVGAWVKTTASGLIIQQRDGSTNGYIGEYVLQVNASGTVNFYIQDNGPLFSINSTTLVDDGLWHQITAVRSGDTGSIYIDGVLSATGAGAAVPLSGNIAVAIGDDIRDNNTLFIGAIDNVSIYNLALSAGAIANIAAKVQVVVASAGSPGTVNVLSNVIDPNGGTLHVTGFTQPAYGTVTNNGGGSFTYTTSQTVAGLDTFTYTLSDGLGYVSTRTANVTIVGLIASYSMNEGSGSTTADSSGDGYTGTLNNTAWTAGATGAPGDYALSFNGTSSDVTFTANASPSLGGSTNFSVGAWIKTTSSAKGVIIQQRDATQNGALGEYGLQLDANGAVEFYVSNGTVQFDITTTATVNDGQWHQIMAVRNGSTGIIYIDGAQSATGSGPVEQLNNSIQVAIGADIRNDTYSIASWFNGTIDDVTIDDFALSASAVANGAALLRNITVSSGSPGTVNVLSGAVDPNGGTLFVASFTQGTHGTVSNNGGGSLTYTASTLNAGYDSFTFTLSDGMGYTATGTVGVTVLGLIADYNLNEGTGSSTADATGNGYTGTLNNTTWTTGLTGQAGDNALSFDGVDSDVTFSNSPSLNGSVNFSVGAWVKTTTNAYQVVVQQRDANGYNGQYSLQIDPGGTVEFYVYNGGYQFDITTTTTVDDGNWHQITAVRNGSTGIIYIDGVQSATGSGAVVNLSNLLTVDIGADTRNGDAYFNGTIDDVMIFNTAVSGGLLASISTLGPIANVAAPSPSPVTTTSTSLSATAGDFYEPTSPLTYTWTASTIPQGAASPTFSTNANASASCTVATFYAAGSYVFSVTVTDQSGFTTTQTVNVTVYQTATSIVLNPLSLALISHGSETFTAVEDDQFGDAMSSQPVFAWSSSGSGYINSSTGVYTADYASGTAAVTASAGALSGVAAVTVTDVAPTIPAPIAASSLVTGTSTALSVSALDDAATGNLIYQWTTVGTPPAAVTFSANDNGSAGSTVATFTQAGTYTFDVTVTDLGGLSNTSSTVVVVDQTDTATVLAPASVSLPSHGTQTFSATEIDQFGNPLATQPTFTWSSTGSGSINSSTGVYVAGYATGTATVMVTGGLSNQSASVVVTDAAPAVTTPNGSSNPVTGTTVTLLESASDDAGPDNLSYAWTTAGTPPAAVSFFNSSAASTVVTFSAAGTYTFNVTVTDLGGLSSSSNVIVTVDQTGASIVLTPATSSLVSHGTQAFTAVEYDQFGNPLASQPGFSWTRTGLGSVSDTGVYTAGYASGTTEVYAYAGPVAGTAAVMITNAAPVVSTPTATSGVVTGTTVALSETASDDAGTGNLKYTWTTIGTPPAVVSFSTNGNSFAGSTVATFSEAGTYTFDVTVTDRGGLSTTSSTVVVVVDQTATATVITPSPALVSSHGGEPFSVAENDQFGNPMATQPTFTWSSTGAGSINRSTGLYTAAYASGTATVTATSGSYNQSASVVITNAAPVLTTPIASPNPVTGTTVALSESATDDGGAANLSYAWTTVGTPPAAVSFANSSAASTVATFTEAGTYTFDVTVTDLGGLSSSSNVVVNVNQTGTAIFLDPSSVSLNSHGSGTFNAYEIDQFGNALDTQPAFVWSSTGSGSINSSTGTYTAGYASGAATVTATFGSVSASASVTVTDTAPEVSTPLATPGPVTGSTTALTVSALDDAGPANLTYAWTTTGTPPAPVNFSANGNASAGSTLATFTAAGTYTFDVTVTDLGGLSATSSTVTVVVDQTATAIVVSPSSASLAANASRTFTAVENDQFGNPMPTQPGFLWHRTGPGSINILSGVYTAAGSAGTATITATSGFLTGSTSVTITNPTITASASATASPVTATSVALSVAATDTNGTGNLLYTWTASSIPNGAAAPTFSVNGTNASANTIATFSQAGTYTFAVTITDGQGGTATSSVSVVVSQTLTRATLSPATISVGGTGQAAAYDQFGNVLAAQPTWSATGGTIDSTGLFTRDMSGGSYVVTATVGSLSVMANAATVPTVYVGAVGSDIYAIRLSPTDSTMEQIFVDAPDTGTPAYVVPISQLSSLSFTSASDGSLTIDFANGNPLPSGGLNYSGGALLIAGTPSGGMGFVINGSQVVDTAAASSPINCSSLQSVTFNLSGGSNTLTQTAQPSAPLIYNAGPLSNTLNIDGGTFTISSDPALTSGSLTVNDNAALDFTAPTPGTGYTGMNLYALNLGPSAVATLTASPTNSGDRTVLELGAVSIATGGKLDLTDNALIVHNGNLAAINALITSGFNANSGYWNGTGIISSTAAGDTTCLTAVGAISNNLGSGNALYSTFDNQAAGPNDVLIKFTYIGDATLNGQIDGTDYSRIDAAYLSHATGWFNGDFNYDGTINGSDYTLIDNAFNTQGAQLAALIATPSASPAALIAGVGTLSGSTLPGPNNLPAQSTASGLFSSTPIASSPEDILDSVKRLRKRRMV